MYDSEVMCRKKVDTPWPKISKKFSYGKKYIVLTKRFQPSVIFKSKFKLAK